MRRSSSQSTQVRFTSQTWRSGITISIITPTTRYTYRCLYQCPLCHLRCSRRRQISIWYQIKTKRRKMRKELNLNKRAFMIKHSICWVARFTTAFCTHRAPPLEIPSHIEVKVALQKMSFPLSYARSLYI